jgi:superfamily II DNA helicase RecQ
MAHDNDKCVLDPRILKELPTCGRNTMPNVLLERSSCLLRRASNIRGQAAKEGVAEQCVGASDAAKGEGVAGRRRERGAITQAMNQMLRQDVVGFRSTEQEVAMHAVLDRETPLVVVLSTGGRKSLLFPCQAA